MPLEVVYRIICRADKSNIGLLDETANAALGRLKNLVAEVINFLGCLGIEDSVISEILAKLQVSPVMNGMSY